MFFLCGEEGLSLETVDICPERMDAADAEEPRFFWRSKKKKKQKQEAAEEC